MQNIVAERRARAKAASSVYVIESENGMVKIGQSCNPVSRLKSINLHSPVRCRLIAIMDGKKADELALHSRFAEFRGHHEWFHKAGAVVEFVASVHGIGVGQIPDWPDVTTGGLTAEQRRSITRERRSAAMRALWSDPEQRAYFLQSKKVRA